MSEKQRQQLSTPLTKVYFISQIKESHSSVIQKNFSYPISKIIKTEMTSNGILIQKENTVNPQIVALDEYELPLSILSLLMNE